MSVFILGGAQTDFARNVGREGGGVLELMREVIGAALLDAQLDASAIQVAHVGNFCGELFTGQGQLGGMLAIAEPLLDGVPASRHEAACASGGVAVLAAMADIEAGRYDCALVLGVELERNVPGDVAARHLGSAAWVGHEAEGARYPWPSLFDTVAQEYERRFGLRYEHLGAIAKKNLGNAKKNPHAQTRGWAFTDASFTRDDVANPLISGWIRRQDCGQVTDGAAAVVLVSERLARAGARKLLGWGHRTSHLSLAHKLAKSAAGGHVFPEVRRAITDAYSRAGISGPQALSSIETHDCFSITEYLALDHFGLCAPGEGWREVERPTVPVNQSGGLIGVGHPVGATGVRMVLDASKRDGLVATLNIGGSATTSVSFVVGP